MPEDAEHSGTIDNLLEAEVTLAMPLFKFVKIMVETK